MLTRKDGMMNANVSGNAHYQCAAADTNIYASNIAGVLKEDNAIIKSQTTSKRFGHMIEMPIDTTKRLTISKKTIISPTYGTSSEKYKKIFRPPAIVC